MSETQTEQQRTSGWMPDDSTFGARLAMVRQKMGWGNIAKAAKECGVPVDSWRNWEVDGREPHRLVTIAMAIATKSGCDYLWLVHGPSRGAGVGLTLQELMGLYAWPEREGRVIKTISAQTSDQITTGHREPSTRQATRTRPGRRSLKPNLPIPA